MSENKEEFERDEAFENKCMDIIEQIVSIDEKNSRTDALVIASKMCAKAATVNKPYVYAVYQEVLKL